MRQALTNARVLTDSGFEESHTVVIHDGRIEHVAADDDLDCSSMASRDLNGRWILPGFNDVQVNGGNGHLFNDSPTVETIRAIGEAHRNFGTTGFLPTLISDDLEKVEAAIDATRQAINEGVPGVLGIHLEGPFLSKDKRGVHDASKFRELDGAAITLLSSLEVGKTLVTIAPETTQPEMIRQLVETGVVVSAGHTNATYEEMSAALGAGVTGFTHLFNAMSPYTSRAPGVVGAALEDSNSWCGVIVDGHHVHPGTLRVAMASKRQDRWLLVSDAMPSVGMSEKQFQLNGETITVGNGKCVTEDGRLAGSDLDMASAVRNTVDLLGIDIEVAITMASHNPAEFLGLDDQIGRIQPGLRASLLLTDPNLNIIETWIDGVSATME